MTYVERVMSVTMTAALKTLLVLAKFASVTTAATTPALQATCVPLGNEVRFACRSDTPAVWVKQSPDLAQVVFLSHNGHPIDSSVDLDRFAFSKVWAWVICISGIYQLRIMNLTRFF